MALFLLCPNLGWIQGQFNFTELSLRYRNIKEVACGLFDIGKDKYQVMKRDNDCKLEDSEYVLLTKKISQMPQFYNKSCS
jgi:hypothetical protein